MKKSLTFEKAAAYLAFAGALLAASPAMAILTTPQAIPHGQHVHQAVGVCGIEADLRIQGMHFIIGRTRAEGRGNIVCDYTDGTREILPIVIQTTAWGPGLGASDTVGKLLASRIGVATKGAASFLGKYAIATAHSQLIAVGADASLGIRAKRRDGVSIPFDVRLKVGPGLEASLDFGSLKIIPDSSRMQGQHVMPMPAPHPMMMPPANIETAASMPIDDDVDHLGQFESDEAAPAAAPADDGMVAQPIEMPVAEPIVAPAPAPHKLAN